MLDWAARHLPEPELAEQPSDIPDRRFHEPEPEEDGYDGSEDECHIGNRKYVGKLTTPEFRAWEERRMRREEEEYADRFDPDEDGPGSGGRDGAAAGLHDIP